MTDPLWPKHVLCLRKQKEGYKGMLWLTIWYLCYFY